MKSKTLRTLSLALVGCIPLISTAQTWDGSSINTTTSTGTPQVGIGTASPTSDLEINHNATYNSGTPPGTGFGTVMKIENTRDFSSTFPSSIPGTDYNLLEINNNDLFSGSSTANTIFSVNTSGLVDVRGDLDVSGLADAASLRAAYAYVSGGDLDIGHPTDGYRNIKASSTQSGIGLYSYRSTGDGSSIILHSENPGGHIEFNSIGEVSDEAGGNAAFMFTHVDPHMPSMSPIMTLHRNTQVSIANLATGGANEMVTVDASGILGHQAIPTAQTLSISGNNLSISNGNTVTLPTPSSGADNLGDHEATKDLDMNGWEIKSASSVQTTFLDMNGNSDISSIGGSLSTTGALGVGASASGGTMLFVSGNIIATGSITANGSDIRFKKISRIYHLSRINYFNYRVINMISDRMNSENLILMTKSTLAS